MAKYTETFADYLNGGGVIPAAFDDISGFTDLFVGEFCDKEIGFETEQLFHIKLETRAQLVIPVYVDKLEKVLQSYELAAAPKKTHTVTLNAGEQAAQSYSLPENSVQALPSAKQHSDAFKNTEDRVEEGFTPDEAMRYTKYIEERKNVLEMCLREFDNLFMRVY